MNAYQKNPLLLSPLPDSLGKGFRAITEEDRSQPFRGVHTYRRKDKLKLSQALLKASQRPSKLRKLVELKQ